MIKTIGGSKLAALVACVVTVSAALLAGRSAAQERELNLFIWSEYIDPELVSQFEEAHNCKVNIALFETEDEALAKLQAGGTRQYDVVVVPNQSVEVMIALELVKKLDKRKLPNMAGVMPLFADPAYDPGAAHAAPYQWGTLGVMWDASRAKLPDTPSWAVVFDKEQRPGAFVMMDTMRDMLGAALIYQGEDLNTTNANAVKNAGRAVLDAKQDALCLGFDGTVGGKNKVLAGTAVLAVVYNGEALRGMEEKEGLKFAVPAEGSQVWVDCMLIPKEAPHPELAHAFINFMLDPQVNATLSTFNLFATPVNASMPLLDEEIRNNTAIYPPAEVMRKLYFVKDLGDATQLYDAVWTAVKAQ